MMPFDGLLPGVFCWVDLAATDEVRARQFYADTFGWTFVDQRANGGRFTRCFAGDRALGSVYPLRRSAIELGVPSHWTPYICVAGVDASVHRVARAGGRLVVAPFDVEGTARIARVEDAIGALGGLWEPIGPAAPEGTPGLRSVSRNQGTANSCNSRSAIRSARVSTS